MYIQYTGFKVEANSRIYTFQVLDPAKVQRAFTVRIPVDTRRWPELKIQDGPAICFERLEKELAAETPTASAEPEMSITEQDILEYVKRHSPPPKSRGTHVVSEGSPIDAEAPALAAGGHDALSRW